MCAGSFPNNRCSIDRANRRLWVYGLNLETNVRGFFGINVDTGNIEITTPLKTGLSGVTFGFNAASGRILMRCIDSATRDYTLYDVDPESGLYTLLYTLPSSFSLASNYRGEATVDSDNQIFWSYLLVNSVDLQLVRNVASVDIIILYCHR